MIYVNWKIWIFFKRIFLLKWFAWSNITCMFLYLWTKSWSSCNLYFRLWTMNVNWKVVWKASRLGSLGKMRLLIFNACVKIFLWPGFKVTAIMKVLEIEVYLWLNQMSKFSMTIRHMWKWTCTTPFSPKTPICHMSMSRLLYVKTPPPIY